MTTQSQSNTRALQDVARATIADVHYRIWAGTQYAAIFDDDVFRAVGRAIRAMTILGFPPTITRIEIVQ